MDRATTKQSASTYYPPRARWHTNLFFYAGRPVRRRVHLEGLRLPGGLSTAEFLLSLALPGFAFIACGRHLLGRLIIAAHFLAALTFVAALGFVAGNFAYGLMIALHATSIIYLEGLWLDHPRFHMRLGLAVCTLVAVWALIYTPVVRFIEHHWLLPVRFGNHVLVVHRGLARAAIKRGDWVAYQIAEESNAGERAGRVFLSSGLGVDPVLALPGDRVRFTKQAVFVNDQPFPLARLMPVQGELIVPQKVWFIWPHLDITIRGGVSAADISAVLQRTAMVPEDQIIGKPFKHWFGRRPFP